MPHVRGDRKFNFNTIVFDCVWYWVTSLLNRWANFTAVCINPIHFSCTSELFYRVAPKSIPR